MITAFNSHYTEVIPCLTVIRQKIIMLIIKVQSQSATLSSCWLNTVSKNKHKKTGAHQHVYTIFYLEYVVLKNGATLVFCENSFCHNLKADKVNYTFLERKFHKESI